MKARHLSEQELNCLLSVVPSKFHQARRLIEHLANNPDAITSDVARTCAIGNISDVAHKVNGYLFKQKLFISCKRPVLPVHNKFGELSNMFEWGIYRLPDEPENGIEGLQNMNELK